MEKRKRMPAFSSAELGFLYETACKFRNIVDDRSNSNEAAAKKFAAWEQIAYEFNSIPQHQKRTRKQLKKGWENLKTQKKKGMSGNMRKLMDSGLMDLWEAPEDPAVDTNSHLVLFKNETDSQSITLQEPRIAQYFTLDEIGEDVKVSEEVIVGAVGETNAVESPMETFVEQKTGICDQPPSSILAPTRLSSPRTKITSKRKHKLLPYNERQLRCLRIRKQIRCDDVVGKIFLEEAKSKKEAAMLAVQGQQMRNQILACELEKAKLEVEIMKKKRDAICAIERCYR